MEKLKGYKPMLYTAQARITTPCKLATLSMLESHLNKAVTVFDQTTQIESLKAIDNGVRAIITKLTTQSTVETVSEQIMLKAYAEQLDQFLLAISEEKVANSKQGISIYNKLVDVTMELEQFEFHQ